MGTITYTIPTAGATSFSVAAAEVDTGLQTILTWANGNIDAVNLSALLAQAAGINQSGQTVKGTNVVTGSESRTNVAFGTMPTPDQVTGIVLPTSGLIRVWYQAAWQESVASAASAAIFVGASQLQLAGAGAPAAQSASVADSGTPAVNRPLFTTPSGLSSGSPSSTNYTGDVTTGQVLGGGPVDIFAAAGTYTVSVQFKASSGSVTALNRKLWVQALSFA